MQLGFSTLYWSGALGDELLPHYERLKAWGYDGVEIPVVGAELAAVERTARARDELGLARTAVGFCPAEANPIDPDPAVRARARTHLEQCLERAEALGAELLGGPIHSAYAEFTGLAPSADERAWGAEVLHAVGESAARRGLRVGVEFLNRFECYFLTTAAQTHALVRAADHPALCTVYDTHHAHIEEDAPSAALEACAPSLGHVQLSESHRGVLGAGQVRWEETFAALRAQDYDGWFVVESFSRHDPEHGGLLRIWRDLCADAEAVARPAVDFVRRAWGD